MNFLIKKINIILFFITIFLINSEGLAIDNKTLYIAESSTEKKIVPNFLIDKKDNTNDLNTLLDGLKLVGDYMEKTILKPNNLNFPISRNQFVNSLK